MGALAEFRVTDPLRDETPWHRVTADLDLALDGRLAIQARLSERVRTYARATHRVLDDSVTTVAFDDRASVDATVITSRLPMASASCTGSPMRSPSSTSTSARPRCRRSALASTMRSTCAIAAARSRRVRRAEIERAILHSLAE